MYTLIDAIIIINIEARPAPNSYNIAMANNCVFTSYPSHSFQSSISHKKKRITTPGPAHYHLKI
jgi:hypothetical protein